MYKTRFDCYHCTLAASCNDDTICSMTMQVVRNPREECKHCHYRINNAETTVHLTDPLRNKSIRYKCDKCRGVFWDLKGQYTFCPHCGRGIVRI